jgi:hypothetical protein
MNKYTVLCAAWGSLAIIASFNPFAALLIGFPLIFVTGTSILYEN